MGALCEKAPGPCMPVQCIQVSIHIQPYMATVLQLHTPAALFHAECAEKNSNSSTRTSGVRGVQPVGTGCKADNASSAHPW